MNIIYRYTDIDDRMERHIEGVGSNFAMKG